MRIALFDWDGTIVDSIDRHFDAYGVVCRRFGLPFDRDVFRRAYAPDWRLMYRQLGMPEASIEDAGVLWRDAFAGNEGPLFPGVRPALERLAAAGWTLAIVSGGHREVIGPQLAASGVEALFAVRVFGDDTRAAKPDPEPVRLALRRAARPPGGDGSEDVGDAVFVGDALDDMRMARAAGVHGVGIVSLLADAAELVAAGASETAPSVAAWVDRRLGRGEVATARDAV